MYCICGEESDCAHFSASHDTPMNAARTISHEKPPSMAPTSASAPDHCSSSASTTMKASTAPAR